MVQSKAVDGAEAVARQEGMVALHNSASGLKEEGREVDFDIVKGLDCMLALGREPVPRRVAQSSPCIT